MEKLKKPSLKSLIISSLILTTSIFSANCKPDSNTPKIDKQYIIDKYKNIIPREWGENVTGVKTSLDTKQKVIALTFDACGGTKSNGYDRILINFLIKENIPATLFINSRWIDANQDIFIALSKNSLFEIENHGTQHKPLSVNGKKAYGINGTANIEEVLDEILTNQAKVEQLTKRKMKFFRSGTAYYDEVAIKIINDLGIDAVNFDVLGDAGATYTKKQVKKAYLSAAPGSIIISHMNHPEKETASGVIEAIPILKSRGFTFIKLEDYPKFRSRRT